MSNKQVNIKHYDFLKYVDIHRFSSYYYQLKSIHEANPNSILEVWTWNWIIGKILKDTFEYKTIDFDENLRPDFIWDISCGTTLADNSFDLVCAFQVLEHIEFDKFEFCLKELKRISKKNVIISLPYCRIPIEFSLKIPLFSNIKLNLSIPKFYKKFTFDWQHYWEIWSRWYSYKKIKNILSKYFTVKEYFIPFENTYHCFFVLEIK